ncbi:hypothetical protein [Bifidobacterium avesanii]|uniref:Uncharacterized protein n=1 Tax=Bifidobacterium avesanii TaxID=1798157 RepID=A0A7K3THC3_9BIFI|nr:hypothetical protein [Bifidobacterium avesanii]KAB8292674.1 hypothetical protein DSM100685_0963 [Bifidobacterium avesanii]NEG78498.1 hypothetical protein [Bifidobacterium avesanii]
MRHARLWKKVSAWMFVVAAVAGVVLLAGMPFMWWWFSRGELMGIYLGYAVYCAIAYYVYATAKVAAGDAAIESSHRYGDSRGIWDYKR